LKKGYKVLKIHALLSAYRKKKNWTWKKLAERCNKKAGEEVIYPEMFSRMKKGKADYKLKQIIALQEVTEIEFLN